MEFLRLNKLNPSFISDTDKSVSEIWFRDITFEKGKKYLVSASSGEGKSSLLSYIFGERNDFSGEIYFDELEIGSIKKQMWQDIRKNHLSFVFQGLRLFSDLTALENIQLKNSITNSKSIDEILYLIEKVGLADKINEPVSRLSFGQQQRIAVIRAICQPFDFILLDEPFSHLDEKNIKVLCELISSELNQKNAGMILCSLGYEYPFEYNFKYNI